MVFPPRTTIDPGETLVLASDGLAFTARYGLEPDHLYNGRLANDGERIRLIDGFGNEIDSVRYDDAPPWTGRADGFGSSLELLGPYSNNEEANGWTASR